MSETNLPSLNQKCQCGCGGLTRIAPYTRSECGWVRGQPLRFIHGHQLQKGSKCFNWKGGINKNNAGYIEIFNPDYRPDCVSSYVLEHILIAEKVLGKPLPPKAIIHHLDCSLDNNSNSNLVICENQEYHLLLHKRTRALLNSGHANWKKCLFCKQYDNPENMFTRRSGTSYHRKCESQYKKERYFANKMKNRQLNR